MDILEGGLFFFIKGTEEPLVRTQPCLENIYVHPSPIHLKQSKFNSIDSITPSSGLKSLIFFRTLCIHVVSESVHYSSKLGCFRRSYRTMHYFVDYLCLSLGLSSHHGASTLTEE